MKKWAVANWKMFGRRADVWRVRLQFASVIGGIKARHAYSQGYALSFDSAAAVYRQQFGELP